MRTEEKYTHKATYRINSRIQSIINRTHKEICRETELKLSLGKVSRAFWVALAEDPRLRKHFIDCICKITLEDAAKKSGDNRHAHSKKTAKR